MSNQQWENINLFLFSKDLQQTGVFVIERKQNSKKSIHLKNKEVNNTTKIDAKAKETI